MRRAKKRKPKRGKPKKGPVSVGQMIRAARLEADMSQDVLATKLGTITRQSLQKYETDMVRVSSDMLGKIAAILNKPATYFFPQSEVSDEESLVTQMLALSSGVELARLFVSAGSAPKRLAILRAAQAVEEGV